MAAIAAAVAVSTNASAQIPDYGVWPSGVTFTDINGVTHDVDAILDAGKTVIIDAFADWCGPCWSYHQQHNLENLYQSYGPTGTDELMVFGIEADPNEPESTISDANSGQGDWTVGTNYPLANDDNLAGIINLGYYPTIIMVCPDRSVTEVGQQSTAALYAEVGTCGAAPTTANDPRIIGQNSDDVFCAGGAANVSAVIQNFGANALTSATIEVFDGTTSVSTTNWTGTLDQFEVEEVSLGTVSPTAATTYTIKITSSNDDVSNDEVTALISPAPVLSVDDQSNTFEVFMQTDRYQEEIGFIIGEGAPSLDLVPQYNSVYNGAPSLHFSPLGTYPQQANNGEVISEWVTAPNAGCHYALFVDYPYQDGVNYNYPSAVVELRGAGGSTVNIGADYGLGLIKVFDIQKINAAGIDANDAVADLSVYPNPTNAEANVVFTANNTAATITVTNLAGQTVYTNDLGVVNGEQNVAIDASNFQSGMYIVNIVTENGVATARISVTK